MLFTGAWGYPLDLWGSVLRLVAIHGYAELERDASLDGKKVNAVER